MFLLRAGADEPFGLTAPGALFHQGLDQFIFSHHVPAGHLLLLGHGGQVSTVWDFKLVVVITGCIPPHLRLFRRTGQVCPATHSSGRRGCTAIGAASQVVRLVAPILWQGPGETSSVVGLGGRLCLVSIIIAMTRPCNHFPLRKALCMTRKNVATFRRATLYVKRPARETRRSNSSTGGQIALLTAAAAVSCDRTSLAKQIASSPRRPQRERRAQSGCANEPHTFCRRPRKLSWPWPLASGS